MNRDTIIGFVLIASILVGYSLWMTPSKEEIAKNQKQQESMAQMREQARVLDSIRMAIDVKPESVAAAPSTDSLSNTYSALHDKFGAFASSSKGEEQGFQLENNVLKINLLSKGGFVNDVELKDYKTFDSLPLIIFDPTTASFDLSFFAQSRSINTKDFYFRPFLNGKPYANEKLKTTASDSLV
ncbi:MAG: hypothetical protein HOO86_15750, partial [Bacteroidales bacterium]|nr:hypothetical protein [Bacteroidales bacterium]